MRSGGVWLVVAAAAVGGCASPGADRCDDGRFCPPYTICAPGNTCEADPAECGRFADGTVCAGPGRSICRDGACVVSTCSDEFVDPGAGEQCDLGGANSDSPDAECRTDCRPQRCGDDILDSLESCDDGVANSNIAPGACRLSCQPAYCGDGVQDPGEAFCLGAAGVVAVDGTARGVALGDLDDDFRLDLVV
ncbi:MAG TPA: hypothetical protein VL172_10890, partial [Kofleriaceae bacterium]|nr:hypothetical protein [Kofleriaceae bacterium]